MSCNRTQLLDIATPNFGSIRDPYGISADFDNDGYDEIFLNNIGQPNAMFRVRDGGVLEPIALVPRLRQQVLVQALRWRISIMTGFSIF